MAFSLRPTFQNLTDGEMSCIQVRESSSGWFLLRWFTDCSCKAALPSRASPMSSLIQISFSWRPIMRWPQRSESEMVVAYSPRTSSLKHRPLVLQESLLHWGRRNSGRNLNTQNLKILQMTSSVAPPPPLTEVPSLRSQGKCLAISFTENKVPVALSSR